MISSETTSPADPATIMVRFTGELAMKGRRTRRRFQSVLVENIRDAYASERRPCEVRREWSRLYVDTAGPDPAAPLARVFGISSWSVVDAVVPAELEAIVEKGAELYAGRVHGRTFAVRARRSGEHAFRSSDVMQQLGAALNPGATVDLDEPDVEVYVEVRDDRARLFADRTPGPGGLPLGAESRALALLSGGFDSAVAAWMLLRRGVALDYVFCNLGGDAYRRLVVEVAKHLADDWSYGTRPRLFVLDFGPVVDELRRAVQGPYLQVALKRQMYRAAEAIADRTDADALVTGEAVGQVSSQTLPNLRAIDPAASRPVLRPLIGTDKEDIVALSRRIGTHDLSARVREYCMISDGPTATGARADTLDREEAKLDAAVLAKALETAEEYDLRRLRLASLVAAGLMTDEIPEDALVVDMRGETDDALPGALRRTEDELREGFAGLDRERPIVLVCLQGVISARWAERLQAAGYEAYSLRGGSRGLRRIRAATGGGER
ncbi:MAG: tRNA uracil 4-sulfurtransferase ThiI [Gemmatimonadales bacterium]|jgi:thiamine biosynthesis protein ThiI